MKAACNYRDNQNCQGLFYGWFCLLSASLTASQAAGPTLPQPEPQTSKDHCNCTWLCLQQGKGQCDEMSCFKIPTYEGRNFNCSHGFMTLFPLLGLWPCFLELNGAKSNGPTLMFSQFSSKYLAGLLLPLVLLFYSRLEV